MGDIGKSVPRRYEDPLATPAPAETPLPDQEPAAPEHEPVPA